MSTTARPLSETKRKLLQEYASGRAIQPTAALTRRPPGINAGLSLAQEQVWLHALALKGVPSFYNESITIHRTGPLDLHVLERSFTEVIRRHEIWRTTFRASNLGPIQIVHPAPSIVAIPAIDLSALEESARQQEAIRLATEYARQPFDLEAGPLVRALLITLNERTHKLFVTMHQAVVDGISAHRIFPQELTTLYSALEEGVASPLPELEFQFADFAYNDRQRPYGREWNRHLEYWRTHLGGFIGNRWIEAICRAPAQEASGTIQPFTIPPALHSRLQQMCREEQVTLFATLLAGLALLFATYRDDEEVAIATVTPTGRKRPETQQMLGYFLNSVALRLPLSSQATIRQLLHQCREVTLQALENDDIPFELIDQELRTGLTFGHGCMLPLALTVAPSLPPLPLGWHQTPMDIDTGWAKWPMYLELRETPGGILGRAQYRTSWFTPATVSTLLQAFKGILDFIACHAGEHISTVHRCLHQALLPEGLEIHKQ